MSQHDNIANLQSSPASFYTARESASLPSSPSFSDFSGFSDHEVTNLRESSIPSAASASLPPLQSLAPPPEYNSEGEKRSFTSLEVATVYVQSWAKDHGYGIRRCRLTKRGKLNTTIRAYFQCEWAGAPRITKIASPFRIRKKTSQKADSCKFGGSII